MEGQVEGPAFPGEVLLELMRRLAVELGVALPARLDRRRGVVADPNPNQSPLAPRDEDVSKRRG